MRHPGQLKSLNSLVNRSGSHLDTLRFEAKIQAQRAAFVRDVLPEDTRDLITTGDLKLGLLTLYVPHSGLASQLRFEEAQLVDALKTHALFRGLRRLQFRVRPAQRPSEPSPSHRAPVSASGGEALSAFSETLSDPELKRQFQQLAARVSGNLPPDQR